MFSRTALEGFEALMNSYREGTLSTIKEWVEKEVIGVRSPPSYDKYTFFNALRMVFAQFMSNGDEVGVVAMLETLNIDFFGTSEDICDDKLGKFRCHLCLALAEAVIEARRYLESNSAFCESLKKILLDLMTEVDYIEHSPLNPRIEKSCTEALRILGHDVCEKPPEGPVLQERSSMRSPPPEADEDEPDPDKPGPSSRKKRVVIGPLAAKTSAGASKNVELEREDQETGSESSDESSDIEY